MSLQNLVTYSPSKLPLSPKATALESTLQQCITNFKELLLEYQQLYAEMEKYKSELLTLKEQCGSQNCSSSEILKKDIESKDNKIQLVASILTTLNETKNFSLVTEAFKILCGDSKLSIPEDSQEPFKIKETITLNVKKKSPNKDLSMSLEDVSMKDESVSEIDGTPGRVSPIILSRKLRSSSNQSGSSVELRDKKKCPESWSTPEPKAIKLLIPTTSGRSKPGSGRMKQQRLVFTTDKPSTFVDLTSSPEFSGGAREKSCSTFDVQKIVKKESSENDDTILPSPTSGPSNFLLSRPTSKENQHKFKKPLSLSRVKHEEIHSPFLQNDKSETTKAEMEDSINILNPNRFLSAVKASPKKVQCKEEEDITHCETQASLSLLEEVNKLDHQPQEPNSVILNYCSSPTKRPLAENINIANVPSTQDGAGESSMSLLNREVNINNLDAIEDNDKRKTPETVEPVYKEPTVRKKAEKRALPAWCCAECESFFGTLYGNDPEKRAKQIAICSKHRGRNNPVRPKTPPGFWDPRWDVPEGTEEFNRRNNAI